MSIHPLFNQVDQIRQNTANGNAVDNSVKLANTQPQIYYLAPKSVNIHSFKYKLSQLDINYAEVTIVALVVLSTIIAMLLPWNKSFNNKKKYLAVFVLLGLMLFGFYWDYGRAVQIDNIDKEKTDLSIQNDNLKDTVDCYRSEIEQYTAPNEILSATIYNLSDLDSTVEDSVHELGSGCN